MQRLGLWSDRARARRGSVARFGITRENPLGGPRYAANPNTLWISCVCPTTSPFAIHRACPLRSACMISRPRKVRHAVVNRLKPSIGRVRRLMKSVVLLDDVVQILALAKIRTRSDEALVSDGLERDRVGGVSCPRSPRARASYEPRLTSCGRTRWPPSCRASLAARNPGYRRWNRRHGRDTSRPRRHARTSRRSDTSRWCASGMADTVCRSLAQNAAPIDRSSYGRHTGPARASCPRDRDNLRHTAGTTERTGG